MAAVTLTSVSTVSPATAGRQQSWAALSNHKSFFYVKDVYYFKPSCKSPFALVVEELKQSLASALSVEEYSFLAKAQVVLTIAHAIARFDDWESMDRCSIRDELCKIDECSDGSPVCRIQVTRFSCGGIAIGFAVLDGLASSALQFPKWWAEVNRGTTMSTPESGGDLEATSSGLVKLAKAASATIGNPVKREVLVINPCKVDDLVREIGGTPLEATSALILQCMTNKDATNKHVSEVKHCGKDVTCVSIPAYETDFGWGKPVHYSPWIGDGMVFILPREEEEGTAMEVQMSQEQMERLLKNATLFATSSTRKKGGKVVILDSIDTIVPAIPTKQPCWVSLTNLDKMLFKNSYLKSVHFYKTSSSIDSFNHMVSKIKDSLSKVLVDHYVFAGRLQENECGEKAVNCNDAGITLRVAHTLARLDEWEDSIEEELNAPEWLIENIPEAPFFHMQAS
ncbi:uncharacterized protein LOC9631090 [Selaginella moellendorffii]|uniref:uncharacterized protein LOC9631090 n=1 Tax=Selaginella moellendorffii TaxID=88036 RepID=UPI000D1C5A37|nr:uncharacterized protein LOC9631090 [Selaginella moellendorffii]|eukprot:XP_024528152.1 uncharacterized protein LOC9631090 [Selaginella moellendorffii]